MNKSSYRLLLGIVLLLAFHALSANQLPDYYSEPGQSEGRQATGNDIDEFIDPYGGGLQLRYVDLTLPGPAGLDINVIRTYRSLPGQPGILGGDYLGTRGIYGLGWDIHFGRVWTEQTIASSTPTGCRTTFNTVSSDGNPVLELADGTRRRLVTADSGESYAFITKDRWIAKCRNAASGGGLDVYSPDGVIYSFSWQQDVRGNGAYSITRIEDRNGNWIAFQYANPATVQHTIIEQITSSDNRLIDFEYTNKTASDAQLKKVSDHLLGGSCIPPACDDHHIVEYFYEAGPTGYEYLEHVQLADDSKYEYDYHTTLPGDQAGLYSMEEVRQPSGGKTNYTYQLVCFDSCSIYPETTALKRKNISGFDATPGAVGLHVFPGFAFG